MPSEAVNLDVAQWCEWLSTQLAMEREEEAWLYLSGKPWPVTPELLFAVKDALDDD